MNDSIKEFPLDDATRGYIAEINQEMLQALTPFQQAMRTALSLFMRQNKLAGDWQLAPDGTKLIKVPNKPEPQGDFTKKSVRKKS